MSRDEALALAKTIAASGHNIKSWSAANGIPKTTAPSRAARAGVRLGVAVKLEKLALFDALRASGVGVEDAAARVGLSPRTARYGRNTPLVRSGIEYRAPKAA